MKTHLAGDTRVVGSALVLGAVSIIHLTAQLIATDGPLADATQILLMPALAAVLLLATRRPRSILVRWVLLALGCSWLGDTIPRFMTGDPAFLTMVGCFLLAQLCYLLALRTYWRHSVLYRPWWVIPYLFAFAWLVIVCAPHAGSLLIPVVIYGAALTLMAVLSTGLGTLAGAGGAIFFISDALIALRSFAGIEMPAHSFWIMLSYVVGQSMIVAAVARQVRFTALEPGKGRV
ncbi:lysoplasmalogenase family protein [Glutamicibacter ardleyensis]|uniref:lysoplasmalogenase family protein n=1 Tax=Glutamicibacter ardleyensis TaxID=225894 RepID=UPI003FD5104E